MRKIIFSVILILSSVSCAAFMEDFGEGKYDVAIQQTAVALALTSEPAIRNDLLLSSYYYSHAYCPPSVWARWSPLQRSLWLESAREDDLRDYERKIKSINDMEMFRLQAEVQRLIDDLKRAKED
jgi:hypothetical protein